MSNQNISLTFHSDICGLSARMEKVLQQLQLPRGVRGHNRCIKIFMTADEQRIFDNTTKGFWISDRNSGNKKGVYIPNSHTTIL